MIKTEMRITLHAGNLITDVLLAVVIVLVVSCNARVEGCLDIEASNFDITIDKHDPSACVYPDLLLNVQYSWDTLPFAINSFYTNDLDQQLVFLEAYVLVSQFALNGVEEGRLVVEDRVNWFLKDGDGGEFISAIDDFTFVDYSRFSFVLGEWRTTDFVDRLDFFVGVPDTLTPTSVDSLNENHVLRESRAYYSEETNEFATARFVIARDSAQIELDTFVVSSGPLAYSFSLSQQLAIGKDDQVDIKIDFYTIFKGVDLSQDSLDIVQQLADNLEGAISN